MLTSEIKRVKSSCKSILNIINVSNKFGLPAGDSLNFMSQSESDRHRLARSNNQDLFKLLDAVQLFDYYQTNSGQTIQISQIVHFCTKGWKTYHLFGRVMKKGSDVVHHLDHNPSNNSPSNLASICPRLNSLLSVWCCELIVNSQKLEEIVIEAIKQFGASCETIVRNTISKTLSSWQKTGFAKRYLDDLAQEAFDNNWENGTEGEDWIMIRGQKCKCVKRVEKPSSNWGGLSGKEMLDNLRKFGFTHKFYNI